MSLERAYRASNRFGFGARPGELEHIAGDPRGWLHHQLSGVHAPPRALADLPASRESLASVIEQHTRIRSVARSKGRDDAGGEGEVRDMRRAFRQSQRQGIRFQVAARIRAGIETDNPFRERLVHFWSNHFTVSVAGGKLQIASSCVGFESEAIRSHLDGYFADMLVAVEQHPVMLQYLDNHLSMGPGSRVGRRRGRGLNENLAREILELHTLGVDGGYTQDDVTSLARIITGWTVANGRQVRGEPGTFAYMNVMHEPGRQRLLGETYDEDGVGQGERALRDLAAHPSTARFLATKLARHFIADSPPRESVDRIARVFMASDGHLPTVHGALVDLDEAWDPAHRKLKAPNDLVTSALRGIDLPNLPDKPVMGAMKLMNQFPFMAPSPAGWPDTADHWGSPNALLQRIDWGTQMGSRIGSFREPARMLAHMSDPGTNGALRTSVERAPSAAQGLALVLAGPDFQWR
jgi:uncharacterized protein (DUF1800 family)